MAILDDRAEEGRQLGHMLEEGPAGKNLEVRVYTEVAGFLDEFDAGHAPDIAFVDIKLNEGAGGGGRSGDTTTGIDVVSQLMGGRKLGTQVVYVSGYDDYHTSVYRTRHAAYLKKPLRVDDVQEALTRALQGLSHYESEPPIMLRFGDIERPVRPRDVSHVESRLRKSIFYVGDERGEANAKLVEAQRLLPGRFVRCHQSFLVNLDYLSGLAGADAVLLDGTRVPVSRRYRASVRDALLDHVRGRGE